MSAPASSSTQLNLNGPGRRTRSTRCGRFAAAIQVSSTSSSWARIRCANCTFGATRSASWSWQKSPSRAGQLFGKLSKKSELVDLDLTLTRAVTKLTGNGLLPQSMERAERDSIFTHPDRTQNEMNQLALSGRWWLGDE